MVKTKMDNKSFWLRVLYSVAINAVLLVVLLLLFDPVEKTDDYLMKSILDGAYGYGISAHLPYCNFFLGIILKLLQRIIPWIAWFEVANYVVIFVSFTLITFAILEKCRIKKALLILSPILIFWGFEGYIKLTFSKTAGIAVSCGLFLLIIGLKLHEKKISFIILGIILAVIGSMFRYKVFLSVLPILAGIVLIEIIIIIKNQELNLKHTLISIIKYVIPMVVCLVAVLGVKEGGLALFKRDELWGYFKQYNTLKAELQDYGWPDYHDNQASYEAIGISYNDYRLWNRRDYLDTDVYRTELLEQVVALKDKDGIKKYFTNITDFFKEFPISFVKLGVVYAVVILFILLILLKQKELKWLKLLYPILMALLLEYYLFCNGRYGMHHIDVGIWIAVALFLLYFLYSEEITDSIMRSVAIFSVGITLFVVRFDYEYITAKTYDGSSFTLSQEDARSVLDIMSGDKNNLYIISNNEYYGLMRSYGTFESIPENALDNVFILSAVAYPSHRAALYKYGYDNICKYITAPNVYYATSYGEGNVEMIKQYIREHYDDRVEYTLVNNINNQVNIYKFYDAY